MSKELMDIVRKPTGDECNDNKLMGEDANYWYFAGWYPQMGGSHGIAILRVYKNTQDEDSCFDVFVWHDGDFPFDSGGDPIELHHCSAEQFIEFGNLVKRLQKQV